jgi:hypothetical protein
VFRSAIPWRERAAVGELAALSRVVCNCGIVVEARPDPDLGDWTGRQFSVAGESALTTFICTASSASLCWGTCPLDGLGSLRRLLCGWGCWMRTTQSRRQSRVSTVEQDVLDAAIDVCVEDWRKNASSRAALVVGPDAWHEVTSGWNPGFCCGLSAVADTLEILTGEPHQLVEWAVAAILQAHGVPPFIARVIGRLVANWLLAPFDPIDKAATRLRVLGVLLCVEDGNLDHCPCLEQLGQDLTIDALKRDLAEDLHITPQPGEPSAPRTEPPHFATTKGDAGVRDRRSDAGPARPESADRGKPPHDVSPAGQQSEDSMGRDSSRDFIAEPRHKAQPGPRPGSEPPGPSGPEPPTPWGPGPSGPSGPEPPGPSGPEPPTPWGPGPSGPSGPEPPEPIDDPDPRLRAACDAVRGAGRVPTSAVFGAVSNLR